MIRKNDKSNKRLDFQPTKPFFSSYNNKYWPGNRFYNKSFFYNYEKNMSLNI